MERDSFIFYKSFFEASKFLSNEDKWKLFDMICQYWLYWNEIETDGPAMWMFLLIKPQLDANNRRYENWCKWWAPEWNSNAVKNWENISKQPKNNQTSTKKQPKNNQKQPNDNDNDNVNDNENEKGCGEEQGTLDANASRWDKLETVGKEIKNGMKLSEKLSILGLEEDLIPLAVTYDGCKKWKKLSKFKDDQLKIRVWKLRKCWFNTVEWMKQVLENSIAWGYEWIFELKQRPIIKPTTTAGSVIKVWDANIFL